MSLVFTITIKTSCHCVWAIKPPLHTMCRYILTELELTYLLSSAPVHGQFRGGVAGVPQLHPESSTSCGAGVDADHHQQQHKDLRHQHRVHNTEYRSVQGHLY